MYNSPLNRNSLSNCYINFYYLLHCTRGQPGTYHALLLLQTNVLKPGNQDVLNQQGSGKMTQTKLRLTIFEVQKLKNIVGLGHASPYQITTFSGDSIGMIGTVISATQEESANDNFAAPEKTGSWRQRMFSSLSSAFNQE